VARATIPPNHGIAAVDSRGRVNGVAAPRISNRDFDRP
jgi:hypothetical protein